MCDTVYVPFVPERAETNGKTGEVEKGEPPADDGARLSESAFFAKNSDRKPQEPQGFFIVPPREPKGSTQISMGREIPVPDKGYACAVSRPSWMWGGEMGVNSHGVAVGNEAVFSREPVEKGGILGMDIVRLTLQSVKNAREGADFLIRFIGEYGQGGNGAYQGKLYYHNSFLLCDPKEAFILETAGRRWVLKRADDVSTISNAYSIEHDFESGDPQTEKEKAEGRSWKRRVERKLHTFAARGNVRARASREFLLRGRSGGRRIGRQDLFALLRYHHAFNPALPGKKNMESICIHPGGLLQNATTGSLVMEYALERDPPAQKRAADTNGDGPGGEIKGDLTETAKADKAAGVTGVVWFTGTSLPCLSLFKPVLLRKGRFIPLVEDYHYREPPVFPKNEQLARVCGMQGAGLFNAFGYWQEHRDLVKKHRPELWATRGCGACRSARACSDNCITAETRHRAIVSDVNGHPFFSKRDLLQAEMVTAAGLALNGRLKEARETARKAETGFRQLVKESFGG